MINSILIEDKQLFENIVEFYEKNSTNIKIKVKHIMIV
jgi:hypothetical protein